MSGVLSPVAGAALRYSLFERGARVRRSVANFLASLLSARRLGWRFRAICQRRPYAEIERELTLIGAIEECCLIRNGADTILLRATAPDCAARIEPPRLWPPWGRFPKAGNSSRRRTDASCWSILWEDWRSSCRARADYRAHAKVGLELLETLGQEFTGLLVTPDSVNAATFSMLGPELRALLIEDRRTIPAPSLKPLGLVLIIALFAGVAGLIWTAKSGALGGSELAPLHR